VPSPRPLEIIESATVRALVEAGVVVIAAGGGGIPVVRQEDGMLSGVEAVIDKDARPQSSRERSGPTPSSS